MTVDEGVVDINFGSRKWDVSVVGAKAHRMEKAEEKEAKWQRDRESKLAESVQRISDHVVTMGAATKSDLRNLVGRIADDAIAQALREGRIKEGKVIRSGESRKWPGFVPGENAPNSELRADAAAPPTELVEETPIVENDPGRQSAA